jgi:hypothetical protein
MPRISMFKAASDVERRIFDMFKIVGSRNETLKYSHSDLMLTQPCRVSLGAVAELWRTTAIKLYKY